MRIRDPHGRNTTHPYVTALSVVHSPVLGHDQVFKVVEIHSVLQPRLREKSERERGSIVAQTVKVSVRKSESVTAP